MVQLTHTQNKSFSLPDDDNHSVLRVCLHRTDVAPLRYGRRPMPWERLLNVAPRAAQLLRTQDRTPAVKEFVYSQFDDFFLANKSAQGYYMPATRRVVVRAKHDMEEPQHNVRVVAHEFAHAVLHAERALLGYYENSSLHAQLELEAEIVSLSAICLLGYQLPATSFDVIKQFVRGYEHIYYALIDLAFEPVLLPAAEEIARAFREVL